MAKTLLKSGNVKVPDYIATVKEVQIPAETLRARIINLVERMEGRTPDKAETDALAIEMIKAHTKDTSV